MAKLEAEIMDTMINSCGWVDGRAKIKTTKIKIKQATAFTEQSFARVYLNLFVAASE